MVRKITYFWLIPESLNTTAMIQFGSILIRCRQKAGLTQQEIADRLGISKSTYHAWESDKAIFRADYLPILADVLKVGVMDLLPPGLTVRISHPNGTINGPETTLTLDARQLYEDLVGSLKETNNLLREENKRLRSQPANL